jgi:hypothetical protein
MILIIAFLEKFYFLFHLIIHLRRDCTEIKLKCSNYFVLPSIKENLKWQSTAKLTTISTKEQAENTHEGKMLYKSTFPQDQLHKIRD